MDSGPIETSYGVGDAVEVSDEVGNYIGVVIECVDSSTLSVQMIKKGADNLYHITDDAYHVPHDAVVQHEAIHGDDGAAPRAYDSLGYRMIDGSTFVKHTDEVGDTQHPVGGAEYDVVSTDGSDSAGSLRDFIVSDSECEVFTQAEPTNEFVRETHAAVRAFNDWVPQDDQQYSMRRFIQDQETRAIAIDDNNRCARGGGAAPAYSQPAGET